MGSRVGLRVPEKQSLAAAAAARTSMYDILSVSESAGQDEIKAAFRKLARKYHPDACRSENKDECTKQFIQVREAYRVLSDPVLRKEYDSRLRNGHDPAVLNCRRRGEKVREVGDWEAQLEGLQKRSSDVKARSSWASRMRSTADAHASASSSTT
ncbi:chaperone protein dnaJ 20, chloroplastic-like [Aristolochia californica]|uniref:chaperone protein dnaJ 20, chloroplastic-like n=1 Tax=Aristolochia californica TaxID=171875 RepID=UPI0035DB470E